MRRFTFILCLSLTILLILGGVSYSLPLTLFNEPNGLETLLKFIGDYHGYTLEEFEQERGQDFLVQKTKDGDRYITFISNINDNGIAQTTFEVLLYLDKEDRIDHMYVGVHVKSAVDLTDQYRNYGFEDEFRIESVAMNHFNDYYYIKYNNQYFKIRVGIPSIVASGLTSLFGSMVDSERPYFTYLGYSFYVVDEHEAKFGPPAPTPTPTPSPTKTPKNGWLEE